jgi:hypothetical protein
MTATKLQALLGLWQQQIRAWAQNGALVSAAVHALGLGQEPLALTALAEALGQGDFRGLPTVELMADDELPGARSHFSDSSQTVFLNSSWLAGSDQDAVLHELTVRWGEHLDTLLNTSDTPGDEGSHFAALLSAGLVTPPK